eukprot:GHVO01041358.1.p1 GENE.GHVO01041358.1~~GHVO01041358.1.p1  ORF type:complete len:129 (+),score=36.78 GHVO01041358.1:23-388(+)
MTTPQGLPVHSLWADMLDEKTRAPPSPPQTVPEYSLWTDMLGEFTRQAQPIQSPTERDSIMVRSRGGDDENSPILGEFVPLPSIEINAPEPDTSASLPPPLCTHRVEETASYRQRNTPLRF